MRLMTWRALFVSPDLGENLGGEAQQQQLRHPHLTVGQRLKLNLKACFESGPQWLSFRSIHPGAFNTGFIGSTCTALPLGRTRSPARLVRHRGWFSASANAQGLMNNACHVIKRTLNFRLLIQMDHRTFIYCLLNVTSTIHQF